MSEKAHAFKGVQGTTGGIDLMIVNIPEGLPVPMMSSPPTSVPGWNLVDKNFLLMVFDLGNSLVHDNRAFLLFHKDDLKLRTDIKGFAKASLLHLERIDQNKLPANHQCHRYIQDNEWFQPCHMLHF